MIGSLRTLALVVLGATAALAAEPNSTNHLTPDEAAGGWLLLWDGETTFGWESHGGAQWRIANGALVADSPEGGWLGTNTSFADFVLRLEFRAAADTNSGIFLRAGRDGAPQQTGYEIQIYDSHPAGYNTGSLVNFAKAAEAKVIPGQWNNFEITANGSHFVVLYNGKKVLDAADTKHAVGFIGLQYNRGQKIEFRNIKLHPLNLRPIFDGKDLSGWVKVDRPGFRSPVDWSVRDGAIHVEKGPGQLETELTWDDFVLQLDVRCNSPYPFFHPVGGIFFRGERGKFWSGYEAQIRNEYKENNRAAPVDFGTGGLYHLQAARRIVSADNTFFKGTIVAQGRQISIWINGVAVSNHADTRTEGPDLRSQARLLAGPISLKAHDAATSLDFRNIQIAPLPKRE